MVTIKDISIITGFSPSTVSKALNDKKDVGVNTKQIIQKVALEKNYQPNPYAVALRKTK